MKTTFAALRYRDFRLLWLGATTLSVGNTMQIFALGWLVVQLSVRDGVPHLASLYLGLVGLASGVPGLLFGLFGGVLADRIDRRKLLLGAEAVGSSVAATLAVLVLTDHITIVLVMILSALISMMFLTDQPARQAMLLRIVPERDLMSAIGLSNATFNSAFVIGPLIGGLLITPFGPGGVLVISTVCYLIGLALALMLPAQPVGVGPRPGVLSALREGVSYIAREPVLLWIVVLSATMSLGGRPILHLLPAVAHDTLRVGAVELSWLFGAAGFGTLLGSLASASLGGVHRVGLVLVGAFTGIGIANIAFAAQRDLSPALLFVVLPGLCHFVFSGFAQSTLQRRAPDYLRGRVMSLYFLTIFGVVPLGTLVLGSLGSVVGVSLSIALGGAAVSILGSFVLLRVRTLRELAFRAPSAPGVTATDLVTPAR